MSKVYNIAFRMGVLFNVLLWTVLNLITFIDRRNNFIALENSEISFSGDFDWGFPLPMFMNQQLFDPHYLVINTIVYVVCGFFFGFLFKFIWSKISRHQAELK